MFLVSHEHIQPKTSAKIKIYTLTRAELLCSLCNEIPCRRFKKYFNKFLGISLWPHCILVDWLLYGNYWRLIEILPCVEGNLYIFTRYHYKKTEKLDRSQECYILLSPPSLRVLKVHQVKVIEKCRNARRGQPCQT